ncbi:MAG: hypothetical protein BA066_04070 [Candidatus Korarchaeota archaeon NZ13-K]|nr:MAG: hypothetical protein BA066_04070 [Candidatus Korarchaeota archaeon NZ13-K]
MRLRIYPPEERARVMRAEVEELLRDGWRLIIVTYDPRFADFLEDLIRDRGDVTIIRSLSPDLLTSLLMLLTRLRGGEACLLDDVLGAYLREASSSPRPYDLQRSLITIMSILRSFERQTRSLVSVHTVEQEAPEWFLKLFDVIEVI